MFLNKVCMSLEEMHVQYVLLVLFKIIYQGISLLLITHLFYEQTLMCTKVGHVKSVPR